MIKTVVEVFRLTLGHRIVMIVAAWLVMIVTLAVIAWAVVAVAALTALTVAALGARTALTLCITLGFGLQHAV